MPTRLTFPEPCAQLNYKNVEMRYHEMVVENAVITNVLFRFRFELFRHV